MSVKRKRTKKIELPSDLQELENVATKNHGEGTIQVGNVMPLTNHIPSGVFILDFALLGGFAQGYVSMVYGYESCGKTTRLLALIGEFQKKNPVAWVGWIDTEGMYDPIWAEKNGVDTSRLLVSSPNYGELAVDIFEDMQSRESISLIIIDSIPHIVPVEVVEKSAEDHTMASHPRLMGKFCSKLTMGSNAERKKGHWVTVILVNQWRSKVGFVMGDPRTLPGGRQLNHIPTTKVELKKKKTHLGKDKFGNECSDFDECSFKLDKVKHGQSIRTGEYQMYLNPNNDLGIPEGGVDNISPVTVFGKKMGFITGGGASWKLLTQNKEESEEFTKFGKLEEVRNYLRDNPEEYECLARSLIAAQRVDKGLPPLPPDGYLVAPSGRLVTLDAD